MTAAFDYVDNLFQLECLGVRDCTPNDLVRNCLMDKNNSLM